MNLIQNILSTYGQQATPPPPPPPPKPVLVIFSGESNSGGEGQNTAATTAELAVRPGLKIMNNDTLTVESLHVGVNNLLGHSGLSESGSTTLHGWELQLGNRVMAGTFGTAPVFLCKTGQGGSVIDNWLDASTVYVGATTVHPWQLFMDRVDAMITYLNTTYGGIAGIYLLYSQGINQGGLSPTDAAIWETKTKAHFDKIRARYASQSDLGKVPVVMTKFWTPFDWVATSVDNICASYTDCYGVVTSDADRYSDTTNPHWSYAGLKVVADRLLNALLANYTI